MLIVIKICNSRLTTFTYIYIILFLSIVDFELLYHDFDMMFYDYFIFHMISMFSRRMMFFIHSSL